MPLLKASRYLAALILIIGAFNMPLAYVFFMRLVITILALLNAFYEKERGLGLFFWLFIGVAFLYNPLFPVNMVGMMKIGINVGCALLWVISAPRVYED